MLWFNGKVDVVFGMQWGSEGKGLICGYLAEKNAYDTVMSSSGANSGHTYINADGRKWVHRHLPNGIVSPNLQRVMIGPGAIINPKILLDEIQSSWDILRGIPIYVHPHATIIYDRHIEEEGGMIGIGSTMKGNGAAVREKILRRTEGANIARNCFELMEADLIVDVDEYQLALQASNNIMIEGAQGYGLGMNSGFYPYTTSRECTPLQLLVDTLVPVQWVRRVIGVCRTFPIRVANRYDDDGKMVGTSGPYFEDQKEISFEDIGVEPELTTVTKLPRRVFTFSDEQMRQCIGHCVPNEIALMFCDYCPDEVAKYMNRIYAAAADVNVDLRVRYRSFGPTAADVHCDMLDPCDYTESDFEEGYTNR